MSRFIRQEGIIHNDIHQKKIAIVGTGAVGRQVGIALAAMGAKDVTIIDFDTVEEVNINTQGYKRYDIGHPKVDCLLRDMKDLDYEQDAIFKAKNEPWNPHKNGFDIIFSCVDSMEARNSIYSSVKRTSTDLLIDGRMAGETLRFLAVDRNNLRLYKDSLFTDKEANQSRCTQQSTFYTSGILANLMIGEMCLFLRGFERKTDKILNLLDYQL